MKGGVDESAGGMPWSTQTFQTHVHVLTRAFLQSQNSLRFTDKLPMLERMAHGGHSSVLTVYFNLLLCAPSSAFGEQRLISCL